MARNVEIKARLRGVAEVARVHKRAMALAERGPELIEQDDTFFACTEGRLKLRAFADGSGELIAYQRPDATGPKTSDYLIAPIGDPVVLRETLARALGVTGRVIKRRTLFLVGRTRVHVDQIDDLGDFLELEVVLGDGEPQAQGVAEAQLLLQRLGIDADALVAGAYVDLLSARRAELRPGAGSHSSAVRSAAAARPSTPSARGRRRRRRRTPRASGTTPR